MLSVEQTGRARLDEPTAPPPTPAVLESDASGTAVPVTATAVFASEAVPRRRSTSVPGTPVSAPTQEPVADAPAKTASQSEGSAPEGPRPAIDAPREETLIPSPRTSPGPEADRAALPSQDFGPEAVTGETTPTTGRAPTTPPEATLSDSVSPETTPDSAPPAAAPEAVLPSATPEASAPRPTASGAEVRAPLPSRLAAPAWMGALTHSTPQSIEVDLADGDGQVRLRTRRDADGLSVVVRFSDPELGALAGLHVRRIAEALEAHFAEPVQLSLDHPQADGEGAPSDHRPPDRPEAAGLSALSSASGSPEVLSRRPLGPLEWIG